MKVTIEDRTKLQSLMDKFVSNNREKVNNFIKYAEESGFSERRIYWDIANAAGCNKFICDVLYKYCDDTHVDTAIKYAYRNLWL